MGLDTISSATIHNVQLRIDVSRTNLLAWKTEQRVNRQLESLRNGSQSRLHENENIQKIFHAQQLYASSNFDTVHQNLLVSSHNISSWRTGIICDTQKFDDPNILISNMSAKDKFLPVKN